MERDLVREDLAHSSATWVVKVGTSVLADPDGRVASDRIERIAEQVLEVVGTGRRVALVSSGAVGAGLARLGLSRRPTDLRHLQAAAAVGQAQLIRSYDDAFQRRGLRAAQLLLTRDDFDDRTRYLNVRNTLLTLFEARAIPVINENDTVSVEEIRFGDNDILAALVTNALSAPLLVILSVVDGVYPLGASGDDRRPIATIRDPGQAAGHVDRSRSPLGSGGMSSKLEAASLVTRAGGSVVIASGLRPDALRCVLDGKPVGTLLPADGRTEQARRRWIGLAARPRGSYIVDDGAGAALRTGSSSLLAIGVVDVRGDFEKGDVVSVLDPAGEEFARGLTNYAASEARRIRGLRAERIASVLGTAPYDEAIHRDNLVLLSR